MALPVVIPGLAAARYYTGRSVGATEWIEITQERIDRFAQATGDAGWIHCDPERAARESPWKAPIAQGYLLLSLAPDLFPRLMILLGWSRAINTAVDDCEFPGAAPVGSRVRMRGTIARARSVPGGGVRLSLRVEFEVEGADEPACKALVHYVYFP
jgi:acyl dehydratase